MSIRNFCLKNILLEIEAEYMGGTYHLTGLIDTGCELTEPLSGNGVIVADISVFKNLPLPDPCIKIRTATGEGNAPIIFPNSVISRTAGYTLNPKTPIVISEGRLCCDGLYNALINPCAIEFAKTQQSTERTEAII